MFGRGQEKKTVIGVFGDPNAFDLASRDLRKAGFEGGSPSAKKLGDLGLSDEEVKRYLQDEKEGRLLLSVRCEDHCDTARDILARDGALNLGAGQPPAAECAPSRPAEATGGRAEPGEARAERVEERTAMPVREEEVFIVRQPEELGEIRVTREVQEEERTLRVPVTHEEVEIERRHVERATDEPLGKDEIHMELHREELDVQKETQVVEEIVLRKRPVTEEREVKARVRKEVPHIEYTGEADQYTHEHGM